MKHIFTAILLASALCLIAIVGAGAQSNVTITVTQVDQSRFPQVDVYVSVTDANGNPVRNIPVQAFQLQDNGQPIAFSAATRSGEQNPVSTVLIIDHSGSMASGGKMTAAKQAASAFVNQMRPGDKTALIQFDTEIDTLQAFTDDKSALLGAIQKLVPRGNTALYDAINQAAKYFEATAGRKAVIVVTDGMDNASKLNRDALVQKASTAGFSIYTIGLGAKGAGYGSQDGIDESALREIASVSSGTYYYRPDATQLSDLYQQLSLLIQNEYKLTYTSTGLRDGVKHNLVVTVPGIAATQAAYNPGGVLPEVEAQASSWVLFLFMLILLLGLFFAPIALKLVRERGLAIPQWPGLTPAPEPKPSRVKLTSGTSAPASNPPRPKIKIKRAASASAQQMPWDDDAEKH